MTVGFSLYKILHLTLLTCMSLLQCNVLFIHPAQHSFSSSFSHFIRRYTLTVALYYRYRSKVLIGSIVFFWLKILKVIVFIKSIF